VKRGWRSGGDHETDIERNNNPKTQGRVVSLDREERGPQLQPYKSSVLTGKKVPILSCYEEVGRRQIKRNGHSILL